MERSLLFGALALGCVGYACGVALTQGQSRRDKGECMLTPGSAFVVAAALLPLLVFLATLPGHPPFAAGHGFGSGFAFGAAGALLSGWLVVRALAARRDVPLVGAAVSAGPLSASVAAVACAQVLLRDSLVDALTGTAVGWFAVTMLLIAGLSTNHPNRNEHHKNDADAVAHALLPLASAAGFTVAVCSIAVLGAHRGSIEFASERWMSAGVVLAAGIPFTVYLCSLTAPVFARIGLKTPLPRLFTWLTQRLILTEDGRAAAARVWRAVAASAVLLVLAKLLSTRVLSQPHLFTSAAAGVVAGWICWWLVAEGRASRATDDSAASHLVPLAVLLLLGVAIVAYNQLAGFGVAAAVLGTWLSFAMAQAFIVETRHESSAVANGGGGASAGLQGLLHVLLFGVGFLLYRVVTTRFADDLRGVGLADHYGIAGFLAGAVTPVLLAALMPATHNPSAARPARTLLRLVVAGLLTLAIPAVALILWKSKAALALVAGLSLATVSPLWAARNSSREPAGFSVTALYQALFALGLMLALSQWTHQALGFASLTRDAKIGLVTWIVGGLIAAMVVLDIGSRIASRRSGDDSASSSRPVPAGGADQ